MKTGVKQKGHLLYTFIFFLICIFFSFVALAWELKHRLRFHRRVRFRSINTARLQSALHNFAALQSCRDPS